jgi:hypothetical protein
MPIYLRPYIDFWTHVPNASETLPSSSETSGTARSYLPMNFSWAFIGSRETPITFTPALAKSGARAVKSCASRVQPDVSSLG